VRESILESAPDSASTRKVHRSDDKLFNEAIEDGIEDRIGRLFSGGADGINGFGDNRELLVASLREALRAEATFAARAELKAEQRMAEARRASDAKQAARQAEDNSNALKIELAKAQAAAAEAEAELRRELRRSAAQSVAAREESALAQSLATECQQLRRLNAEAMAEREQQRAELSHLRQSMSDLRASLTDVRDEQIHGQHNSQRHHDQWFQHHPFHEQWEHEQRVSATSTRPPRQEQLGQLGQQQGVVGMGGRRGSSRSPHWVGLRMSGDKGPNGHVTRRVTECQQVASLQASAIPRRSTARDHAEGGDGGSFGGTGIVVDKIDGTGVGDADRGSVPLTASEVEVGVAEVWAMMRESFSENRRIILDAFAKFDPSNSGFFDECRFSRALEAAGVASAPVPPKIVQAVMMSIDPTNARLGIIKYAIFVGALHTKPTSAPVSSLRVPSTIVPTYPEVEETREGWASEPHPVVAGFFFHGEVMVPKDESPVQRQLDADGAIANDIVTNTTSIVMAEDNVDVVDRAAAPRSPDSECSSHAEISPVCNSSVVTFVTSASKSKSQGATSPASYVLDGELKEKEFNHELGLEYIGDLISGVSTITAGTLDRVQEVGAEATAILELVDPEQAGASVADTTDADDAKSDFVVPPLPTEAPQADERKMTQSFKVEAFESQKNTQVDVLATPVTKSVQAKSVHEAVVEQTHVAPADVKLVAAEVKSKTKSRFHPLSKRDNMKSGRISLPDPLSSLPQHSADINADMEVTTSPQLPILTTLSSTPDQKALLFTVGARGAAPASRDAAPASLETPPSSHSDALVEASGTSVDRASQEEEDWLKVLADEMRAAAAVAAPRGPRMFSASFGPGPIGMSFDQAPNDSKVLIVTQSEGAAAAAGVVMNDRIVEVNGKQLHPEFTVDDLFDMLMEEPRPISIGYLRIAEPDSATDTEDEEEFFDTEDEESDKEPESATARIAAGASSDVTYSTLISRAHSKPTAMNMKDLMSGKGSCPDLRMSLSPEAAALVKIASQGVDEMRGLTSLYRRAEIEADETAPL
jgi:hypothetical protein